MLLRLLVVLALTLASAMAAADQPDHKADARAAFKRGQALYRLGKFEQALSAFQQAARRIKHPSVTINMAQCHRNMGNRKQALFFYKLYVSQWRRTYPGKPVPHEDEVNGHIARLRAAIKRAEEFARRAVKPGLIKVEGWLVDRAQVLIDDDPRGVWPVKRPIPVKPGKREVRVEAEGYYTWRAEVQIKEGETRVVTVNLLRVPERTRSRLWLAVWIGSLVVAGGMEAMGIAYQLEANSHFEETPSYLKARDTSIAGHVTAGVMAAVAVTSFVLWLRSGEVEAPISTGGLAPLSGGAAATWTVRF